MAKEHRQMDQNEASGTTRAPIALSDEEMWILLHIYRFTRPTAAQLHRLVCPQMAKSTLYEKLQKLVRLGLIESRPLHLATRYYVLKARGAHRIGIEKLSGNYTRRRIDLQFHQASSLAAELELMVERAAWEMATTDAAATRFIGGYLAEMALSERGVAFEPHQFASSIPRHMLPDRVISTPSEVFVCIVGHPHAAMAFWSRRLHRYRGVIHDLRFVFVPLTPLQRLSLQQAFVRNEAVEKTRLGIPVPPREACLPEASGVVARGNFLILLPPQLDELTRRF